MKKYKDLFDNAGITTSSLCILHCIGTVAFFFLLPSEGLSFFLSEKFHRLLAFTVLSIGFFAFISGYRIHRNNVIITLALLGLSLLITPHIFSEQYINEGLEISLTLLGGGTVIIAHWKNRICCKNCQNKIFSPISSNQDCHKK